VKLRYLIGRTLIVIGDSVEQLQRFLKRILPKILVLAVGFFLGYLICAQSYQREFTEREKVTKFIGQIVSSVINRTEFYKERSTAQAIANLENHAVDFTDFYKIDISDKTFDAYESIVTFDNGKKFYVDVILRKEDVELFRWIYMDPTR
jgi:hypothetical protein